MNSNYVAETQSTYIPNEQLFAGQHVSVNICVSGYKLLVRDTCCRPTCCPGVTRLYSNKRCIIIILVVCMTLENMEKKMSMLLMLVILGLLIPSSQAITCYQCTTLTSSDCDDPFSSSDTCSGAICAKTKTDVTGWLTVQGGAKNGATLSHCKYSENSITELRGNW